MKNTMKCLTAVLVASSLLGASGASAFTDIQEENSISVVKELQAKGIIQGISTDRFAPAETITTAQAIQMIVNLADLKVQPNFTGRSFDSVPKHAWYADAVNIAAQNGLSVSADMKWNEPITREGFAVLLSEAIQKTGNYPLIMMYLHVADEDQMKEESRGAVQFLLLTKIAKLDAHDKFYPAKSMTRMEAAELAYQSVRFIEQHQKNNIPKEPGKMDPNVSISISRVDDAQNKVTVTKHELAHPGYGIKITSVDYVSDSEAVIYYKVLQPDPDMNYPQVISSASDDVIVPSKYTKVNVQAAGIIEFTK
ncbi:S-layer protein [Bacillus sp. FJAT-18019]|nr:S-layer protein [Bacillus sp. FJAT-18019]